MSSNGTLEGLPSSRKGSVMAPRHQWRKAMTRLRQERARRAKLRETQNRLEAILDEVIARSPLSPSEAFEAVLAYAIDGLVVQKRLRNKTQALEWVSHALTKRGLIG